MKTIISALIVLCIAGVVYKFGLPAYQNYQVASLNKQFERVVTAYDAADTAQRAVLQPQWLALLDKRIENNSVASDEIRKALGELNKEADKHEARLLRYLSKLSLARNLDENIQFAQLLYKKGKRELSAELQAVIAKILTEKPREPATLLILADQSLLDGDRDLVARALELVTPQLPEKGRLRAWANKLQAEYDTAKQ